MPATSTTQWTARESVPLLVGGDDITAQGWTTVAQTPSTLTYGADYDAAKVATVSIDGVAKLTRTNFTTTGTIAIGDQTNDANVDGAVRIKSVERLCPWSSVLRTDASEQPGTRRGMLYHRSPASSLTRPMGRSVRSRSCASVA